ncbi:Bifunctional IPC transferase and DIPP synthase [bacterium HR21]|nr:Bifunctional IPC transferase and DIPP synthase [bacterium HR21]
MGQAVILAAGLGSRLAPWTPLPKPLVPVGGRPLLLWALQAAEQAGCTEAILVLGYRAQEIWDAVTAHYTGPLRLRSVYNPEFRKQNGLSVLAARPYVEHPFLLLMADHLIEPAAVGRFRSRRTLVQGALLVVDSRLEQVVDLADATKVQVHNGQVRAIGKELVEYNAVDTGIFLATADLLDALAAVAGSRGDASLTDGVRELVHRGLMYAEELGDYFWQDVDTAETYAVAERWAQQFMSQKHSGS